jgi:hypothetical protein
VHAAACAIFLLAACTPHMDSGDEARELHLHLQGERNETLVNVRAMAVDAGGDIWLVAEMAPFVHRYGADGRHVGSFGRAGAGPGELRYPQGIFFEDAGVRIWDQGNRRLIDFTAEGEFTGWSHRLETGTAPVMADLELVSFARGRIVQSWNEGYLMQEPTSMVGSARGVTEAVLLVLDRSGTPLDTLVDFRRLSGAAAADLGSGQHLIPIPLWTTCSSGEAVLFDPYAGHLRWFAFPGSSVAEEWLEPPSRPLEEDEMRRWAENTLARELRSDNVQIAEAESRRIIDQVLSDRRDDIGTVAPWVVNLLCDPDGRLWFQEFDTSDDSRGFGRHWIVYERGSSMQRVRLPARFQPHVIGDSLMYGILRDELDVEDLGIVRWR